MSRHGSCDRFRRAPAWSPRPSFRAWTDPIYDHCRVASVLHPRKASHFPAPDRGAVAFRVAIAFETFSDIVAVFKTGSGQSLCRLGRPLPRSAQAQDGGVPGNARFAHHFNEMRIRLHGWEVLPRHSQEPINGRKSDIDPFRDSTNVEKHGFGISLQLVERLPGG